MRRGFLFTAIAISFFVVLLLLASTSSRHYRESELEDYSRFVRVHGAWQDVSGALAPLAGINLSRNYENVSFADALPARRNHTLALEGYSAFLAAKYAPGLYVQFLNATRPSSLQYLPPVFTLRPFGINYTYWQSSWLKPAVIVQSDAANYSRIRNASLSINVSGLWFSSAFNGACAAWSGYAACSSSCFNLSLALYDANGSVNRSSCYVFNPRLNNTLKLNFANATSGGWVSVAVGNVSSGNVLLNVSWLNVTLATSLNMTLDTPDFDVTMPYQLVVQENVTGYSKAYWATAG